MFSLLDYSYLDHTNEFPLVEAGKLGMPKTDVKKIAEYKKANSCLPDRSQGSTARFDEL